MRQPNFDTLLRVLDRGRPDRPTLFEFFLNWPLYCSLTGQNPVLHRSPLECDRVQLQGFLAAGYDYATLAARGFSFPRPRQNKQSTISLNQGTAISDRDSFDRYPWPDPESADYATYEQLTADVPRGAKIIAHGPSGVLENVVGLVGYENLCIMSMMDEQLTADIFEAVGSRLVRYYEICAQFDTVGACISNDDWGFKTQTMLSTEQMRRYVFPWHKKIVEKIHAAGKPAILHSCGNLEAVMEDIIEDMGYDGKHSFEDTICPVEEAYEQWGDRIAILGGIDVDFLVRSALPEIHQRARNMLQRSAQKGAYALGSGNSIPEYISQDTFFAMTAAAVPSTTPICA